LRTLYEEPKKKTDEKTGKERRSRTDRQVRFNSFSNHCSDLFGKLFYSLESGKEYNEARNSKRNKKQNNTTSTPIPSLAPSEVDGGA
jgi:hypothetical protein